MSVQFSSAQIPEPAAGAVASAMAEEDALQVAPSLRKRSRELRAASESLRQRNLSVILHASYVSVCASELEVRITDAGLGFAGNANISPATRSF